MKRIAIDIETYSSCNLSKTGVYKYAESEDFEVLLFAYSIDEGAVNVVDLTSGEKLPEEILSALVDESIEKWAFNANFERVCLSRYLDRYLSPDSWYCTMVWSAYLGLPLINRENVDWLVNKSGVSFNYDMIVIDELSSFKSHRSKRFKALMKVRPKVKRIVGLTGTLSSNGLMDLWAEFRLLDMGERLGKFIGQYTEIYFKPDKRNGPIVYSYKPYL